MAADMTMTPADNFLYVKVAGEIKSVQEVVDYSAEYRIMAETIGIRRIFIDYREAHFLLDYHDLLKLADYGVKKDFQLRGLRIAALPAEDGLELHRQYETVAKNRSITYRAFLDEAEAMEWLMRS